MYNYSDGDPHIWGLIRNVHRGTPTYTCPATVTEPLIMIKCQSKKPDVRVSIRCQS